MLEPDFAFDTLERSSETYLHPVRNNWWCSLRKPEEVFSTVSVVVEL